MSEIADAVTPNKGMGAIPSAKGVSFRVWAPHAEKVYVTGTFNDWSKTSTPLVSEKNGYWSTEVSEAKVGDEYRYLIHGPKGPLSRIDPYARKVTNSIGNGVIYDPKAFDWGDDTLTRRPMNACAKRLAMLQGPYTTLPFRQTPLRPWRRGWLSPAARRTSGLQ